MRSDSILGWECRRENIKYLCTVREKEAVCLANAICVCLDMVSLMDSFEGEEARELAGRNQGERTTQLDPIPQQSPDLPLSREHRIRAMDDPDDIASHAEVAAEGTRPRTALDADECILTSSTLR